MGHVARRDAVGNPTIALMTIRLHYGRTVEVITMFSNIFYNTCTRYTRLVW